MGSGKNVLKKVVSGVTGIIAVLVLFVVASAETPFGVISTEELKVMMEQKKEYTLIDSRTGGEYQEAHIAGAINIPDKTFEDLASLLPVDRNSLLVIYCNGVKCGKSRRVAEKAAEAGYSRIVLYAEGFPVWEENNLPIVAGPEYGKKIETTKLTPEEIKKLIDAGKSDYVLVDVREQSEFREGHIPTAINIPVETFALKSEVLPKEKKVIVYCNTGSRSYLAYRKLGKLAYKDIYQTLFADWKEVGYPIAQ